MHQGLVCLDGLKKSKTMRSDGFRPFVLRTHPGMTEESGASEEGEIFPSAYFQTRTNISARSPSTALMRPTIA